MDSNQLKGIRFLDGTKEDFDTSSIENGFLCFIRDTEDKEDGYLFFNGKKYANGYTKKQIDDKLGDIERLLNEL